MEPGEQRRKVRTGMPMVFTRPCSHGPPPLWRETVWVPAEEWKMACHLVVMPSLSISRTQQRTISLLLDPLRDIGTYMSGAVLESLGEQQFPPRESQVCVPQKGAARLGKEGRISTFQVQSTKVRALQHCKLFRVCFCQDCEFKPEPSPDR